ncbi:MAG: cupredoxin family copper-binding protein [Actinomycetota bacterium]|nr:cupredoxin family copper-binding protein [Actinomycetota bacterium]
MEQRAPEADIVMQDYAFQPDEIYISLGSELTWVNNDSVTHTVTADDGSFDSGSLRQGDSFSFTFKEKGTFKYHCRLHPRMHGTVVVE